MKPTLRDYQSDLVEKINASWNDVPNVLAVAPTGAGKTVIISNIVSQAKCPVMIIAHRQEILGQLSIALGKYEVKHRIIGTDKLRQAIMQDHMRTLGCIFVNQTANVCVASVDTIIRRDDPFYAKVGLWVVDEAHHVVMYDSKGNDAPNKWGRALSVLPKTAKGLGVTATPCRTDKKYLGRPKPRTPFIGNGVFDTMHVSLTTAELITRGSLCDYKFFAPPTALDRTAIKVTSSGEFDEKSMLEELDKSKVYHDAVESYIKLCPGKRAITFVPSLNAGRKILEELLSKGVYAELVTGSDDMDYRRQTLRRFERGELHNIINCDLFGEGTDLPACDAVILATPTKSLSKYLQACGRALRPDGVGKVAFILDCVGNYLEHGLPCTMRDWKLYGDKRKKRVGDIITTTCPACFHVYEGSSRTCPACSVTQAVDERKPARVHITTEDLIEIDRQARVDLINQHTAIMGAPNIPWNVNDMVKRAIIKKHTARREAHIVLRETMDNWFKRYGMTAAGGVMEAAEWEFEAEFGKDPYAAQVMSAPDAIKLTERINRFLEGL